MSYCFGGELEMTETEKLKAQIQELQEKLQKLEEIEKQPRMNLQQEGEYAVVSYHDKVYYRLEGETTFSWYIKKSVSVTHLTMSLSVPNLVMVEDAETERLLEGIYYNHIQVKKEKEQQTKSPVEEAYKDWWGQYPELETDGEFDVTRWHGFRAGYEFAWAIAHAKKVVEKVQEEQEDTVWKSVALRFGEKLSDVGPVGYYDFTPEEWFDWAVFFTYGKEQQKDYKVGVGEPSMTNCVLTGNPPNGYVAWNEWYNEMGSKGILHNLKISSKDYKPTPQERGERVHKEVEELSTKIHDGYDVVEYQSTDTEMLEFLLNQFQAYSLKMNGESDWVFMNSGFPMNRAKGRSARDAVITAMEAK
jgi:cell division septum initiation protein DivIVA